MSFIPRGYSVGEHVRINQDLANSDGTFQAGHEFEISDMYVRHGSFVYELRDSEQNLLGDVEPALFTRMPDDV
jgi:hypothetical protein